MTGRTWQRLSKALAVGELSRAIRIFEEHFGIRLHSSAGVPLLGNFVAALFAALSPLSRRAVFDNPHLRQVVRVPGDAVAAYRGAHTRSPHGPGTIEIGLTRLNLLTSAYGGRDSRFLSMVRHEVGHALSVSLGIADTLYEKVPHSPWRFQSPYGAGPRPFLQRLVPHGERDMLRLLQIFLTLPPGRDRTMAHAFYRLGQRRKRAPSKALLAEPLVRHLGATSKFALPCYHHLLSVPPSPHGLLCFYDSGYHQGFVCDHRELSSTRISDYQMRAPNEWFAELYAYHFTDVERGKRPGYSMAQRGAALLALSRWLRTFG